MKLCKRCGDSKPHESFHKDKYKIDGLCYYCKECVNKQCLEYSHSKQGKAKRAEYNKQWSVENAHKKNASCRARQSAKYTAIVAWSDLGRIEEFYRQARDLGKSTGIEHEVDHIVPLRSKLVCGLHVEANLRVIPRTENRIKGNLAWPDCP